MTEYDYSPDAWERYLETQQRIARWVDRTQRQAPCDAFSPATPHLQALALKEQEREQERRRRYQEEDSYDDSDSSDTEYRKRTHHRNSRSRHHHRRPTRHHHYEKTDDLDREYVFVETAASVQRSSPSRPRKGNRNLTIDLQPFPTTSFLPQDPYSYRNSTGHSSHSSNTTTPTNQSPMGYPLPPQPYSAPPLTGRGPVLGGGAPKPLRSQTMPMHHQGYMYPQNPAAYQQQMGMGYPQPVMVPLRPGMKGYTSYGPDPSKNPQIPWSDYVVPASPTSTKPPSLLKRMFNGLRPNKDQQPQPQQPYQYPTQSPNHSPSKSSKYSKESSGFHGGGGSRRMARKRSVSF